MRPARCFAKEACSGTSDVWGGIGAFPLGGVGWLVTSFFGAPLRRFLVISMKARFRVHMLVFYGNTPTRRSSSRR